MISVSGIRGVFGPDLNPENIALFTAAFGTWTKGGKIVVGRDSRVTGDIAEASVIAALQATGCKVIQAGVVPTPTVAMGVLRHQADGGVIITASHNPAQWNGLKFLNSKGEFLDEDQINNVIRLSESKSVAYKTYKEIGSRELDEDLPAHHIREILNLPYINADEISSKSFKIAVDAVNGAGSRIIPDLLYQLGVTEVVEQNCIPNGDFAHDPEPTPVNLDAIRETVRNEKCDLGIAVDPDADRLAFVDEQGDLFGEEYTLAATMDFYLSRNKGPIAVNLSSSRVNEDIAHKYGVECFRSAVGEISVVKEMQQRNAVIGGEGNGGVINPDLHYGRDALVGSAMLLQHLAELDVLSSEYRKSLPHYEMIKTKISLNGQLPETVISTLQETFRDEKISTIDGLKIDFDDGWVHLRKSNTEPIMRVFAEAKTIERARELANEVIDLIPA